MPGKDAVAAAVLEGQGVSVGCQGISAREGEDRRLAASVKRKRQRMAAGLPLGKDAGAALGGEIFGGQTTKHFYRIRTPRGIGDGHLVVTSLRHLEGGAVADGNTGGRDEEGQGGDAVYRILLASAQAYLAGKGDAVGIGNAFKDHVDGLAALGIGEGGGLLFAVYHGVGGTCPSCPHLLPSARCR